MLDVSLLTVHAEVSVRDALDRLNRTGSGVLLLVDAAGRLLRTVTDGDLRRLLLSGAGLDASLRALPGQSPVTAKEGVSAAQALALMNERVIDHLPVLDAAGRPVEVLQRRELDSQILLSTPHLSEQELAFVEEAFKSNWIAPLGPNVDAFEREVAARVGVGHAAAVSSGTAALHLAIRLLGIGPGDSVFTSTLTFVASVNPILYEGARPVFIDSEPQSWNMSPQALALALEEAAAAGKLPKAVVVVDLYGQSADMDALAALCEPYGVALVEDAAESLGATYKGRQSGSFGKLSALSFNGNKIITTSGGGMLLSDDARLVEQARFLSTQARDAAGWYQHSQVGYNYRMSNVLAGIGRGQLRVLGERVAARRAVFDRYREALADVEGIGWMPETAHGLCTRWLSVCVLDPQVSPVDPAELIGALARSGIEARRVWKPMHQQPLFAGCKLYRHSPGQCFADDAFAHGVCLPSGSNLGREAQERIVRTIKQIFARHSPRARAAGA
jgi:dTDP-4-amino-4,6-dideoxygalactose transaminase